MTTERRVAPRVKHTFKKYLKRWIDLSLPRKIIATVIVAGGISGTAFAACRGSDIAGPSSPSASAPAGGRPHGDVLPGDIPELPSLFGKEDEQVAQANPDFVTTTETTFETTEAVYNPCMNETPVMNGFIRVRSKTKVDGLTLQYKLQTWKDTRGVAATATAYWDHDGDPATPMQPYTVRYHNRENALDKFEVGPAGLPFRSIQESRIWLQREGDPHKSATILGGDDLFVFASQKVVVDQNGIVHEKFQYRTECK